MKHSHILFKLLIIVLSLNLASSFTDLWQNFLNGLSGRDISFGSDASRRTQLKQQLSVECRKNAGIATKEVRQSIEAIISDLTPLNPTKRTSLSPLLKREWILEWTTEKEINFFLQTGISNRITQTLTNDILQNYIPFVKGGGFGVTGQVKSAEGENGELLRTNFKFLNAKLDLGRWGEYNIPPVGEGWFDTIYLDNELRIDTNSRNDILICRGVK